MMVSGHVDRRERTSAYAIVGAFWLTLVAVFFPGCGGSTRTGRT